MSALLRPATLNDTAAIAQVLNKSRLAFIPYASSIHSPSDVQDWVFNHLVLAGDVLVADADKK
jgi:hypothetical protein